MYTNRIAQQRYSFAKALGFTIHQEDNEMFWGQIGWSKLYFKQSINEYKYHYCFIVPVNKLTEAMRWLSTKVNIIAIEENEKVAYFDD